MYKVEVKYSCKEKVVVAMPVFLAHLMSRLFYENVFSVCLNAELYDIFQCLVSLSEGRIT